MSKFHINSKGEIKPCKATIKSCLYSSGEHFNSENEALKYMENNYSFTIGSFKSFSKASNNKPIDNLANFHHKLWRNRNNLNEEELEVALSTFITDNSYYGLENKKKVLLEYFTQMNNDEWTLSKVRKDLNNIIGV